MDKFVGFRQGGLREGTRGAEIVDELVIVPEACVTDRAKEPHEANLFDINMKLGDVVPVAEVLAYLATFESSR